MSKQLTAFLLFISCYGLSPAWAGNAWQRVQSKQSPAGMPKLAAAHYLLFSADENMLKRQLAELAGSATTSPVALPMPDGTFKEFMVTRSGLLPDALLKKYPAFAVYTGVAANNKNISAKLDFTEFGFHAMVFDGNTVSFIDPANDQHDGYYTVHYKNDELPREEHKMSCDVRTDNIAALLHHNTNGAAAKTTGTYRQVANGDSLRIYRLALACDHQYAAAVVGGVAVTINNVLSRMITTMNRVNGVYERELSVRMEFVADEDKLIFIDATADPVGGYNDDAVSLLFRNQIVCDSIIGNTNYDLGHVFTTGAGGLSQLGVVCMAGMKAQSVTGQATPTGDGFDIDYVAHEMGHEFGSQHTFNNNVSGSCAMNAVDMYAYEPGSGSTIMCYAGICSPDNVQLHSDAYFSGSSLEQIQYYINAGGNRCAIKTPTGNKVPVMPGFNAQYTIPYLTPFELTAPAATNTDADITYCWEQWDLGNFGKKLIDTHEGGPIFRSYAPVTSQTRVFPNMDMVLAGSLSNAGVDNSSGEKASDVSRQLNFRLALRDVYNGNGYILIPEDTVGLFVINTGAGFKVTSQATDGIIYDGNTNQQLTWDVAGSDKAPIKAATVDVYMSADSGRTWSYNLGPVPNTGTAMVTIPNPDTTIPAARFKVKGTDNVFFNVNSKYFRVNRNLESAIHIYPVPTHDVLHIIAENSGPLQAIVYSAVGRSEWKGTIIGHIDISTALWARGVYFLKLVDGANSRVIRKLVID